MNDSAPRVLVVVLSYNKRDLVLQCIASLVRQSYSSLHTVVVDNASSDGSVAAIKARYPELDLLCNDANLGAIAGRNAGVEHQRKQAGSDYILFLDDDAEVSADSIGLLVNALEQDPQSGIACGKTYVEPDSNLLTSTGMRERFYLAMCYDRGAGEFDEGQYDSDGLVDACCAFSLMIRSSLFDALGGFDSAFTPYGWEDVDLCLRARALGFRTRYVHRAIFYHRGTRLGRAPIAHYERSKVRNYLILIGRHMNPLQKLLALVLVPMRGLLLFFRFARIGGWDLILAQLNGFMDYWIAARKDDGQS